MTKIKHTFLLIATMMYLSAKAQEIEQYVKPGQVVAGISIAKGALLSYEKSISAKGTLSGIASIHPLGELNSNKQHALFPVSISLEYRNYYNMERRKHNQKDISNNSGNYFGLRTSYTTDALVKNNTNMYTGMFSVGGLYGLQRAFAKRWSYHFNTGLFWVSGTKKEATVSSFWKKNKYVKSAVWPGIDFGIHYILH